MITQVKVFVDDNTALTFENSMYMKNSTNIKIGDKLGCEIYIGKHSSKNLFLYGKSEHVYIEGHKIF